MKRPQLSLVGFVLLLAAALFLPVRLAARPQAGNAPAAPAPSPALQQQAPPTSSSSAPEQKQPSVQSYTLTPEKYQKAVAYSRAQYRLYFIDFIYGLLVLLLVLRWKLAPRY